jgi:hypothetical protein
MPLVLTEQRDTKRSAAVGLRNRVRLAGPGGRRPVAVLGTWRTAARCTAARRAGEAQQGPARQRKLVRAVEEERGVQATGLEPKATGLVPAALVPATL